METQQAGGSLTQIKPIKRVLNNVERCWLSKFIYPLPNTQHQLSETVLSREEISESIVITFQSVITYSVTPVKAVLSSRIHRASDRHQESGHLPSRSLTSNTNMQMKLISHWQDPSLGSGMEKYVLPCMPILFLSEHRTFIHIKCEWIFHLILNSHM